MSELKPIAGRTLMVGLPGGELDRATAHVLSRLGPGGVILFQRNLESASQTHALLAELRSLLDRPLLLALDQEGGRVSRLEPWIGQTPTATALGAAGEDAIRRFSRATAQALRALGFNLDFAPVVDLCEPTAPNGIGDRSFGTHPERVAHLAGVFLDGLQEQGVAGCLKHFPGLGPTCVDSHAHLPTVERTRSRLEQVDLLPYRRLASRSACIMVGHGHYPSLDPAPGRPASLSPAIVNGLLREQLGFNGLVVSDDLEMGAVSPLDDGGRAAVQALAAGCDLLLYCRDLDRAETAAAALASNAETDPGLARRLRRAARTVDETAAHWPIAAEPVGAWEQARKELEASATLT